MDAILIALYLLCFCIVRSSAALVALFLFCASGLIVGYEYDYLVFATMYATFCFFKSSHIKLAGLFIVIFQYLMAWDYALNPTTYTPLYFVYPYVSFMLNLALIISIIKGAKDGFYTADNFWYNDFKFNQARIQIFQRR